MSPAAIKPRVDEVSVLVRAYYAKPENCVGGSLHIVLEDGNVRDCDVKFCLDAAVARGDRDGVELATKLLAMSKTQRKKLGRPVHSKGDA